MKIKTPQPKDLKQKLLEQSVGIRQWERLQQGQELARRSRLIRRLATIQQDAYARRVGTDMRKSDEASDAEESVHIGDEFREVHYHQDKPSEATSPSIVPWLLGAILAAIVAIGVVISAMSLMRGSPTIDTDTHYQLDGDWQRKPDIRSQL